MREYIIKTGYEILALHVFFRVGKNHDPRGKEGLSHFVEHMMSRRNDNNRIMRRMKECYALGFNASTSDRMTDYYLRAHYSERTPWKEFKRMLEEPVFDDYEKEKEVIIEEIRRKHNNPGAYTREKGRILLMGKRLGVGAAGAEETVKNITKHDLENHYKKYYSQENCFIVSAGARLPSVIPSFRKGGRRPRDPKPVFKVGEYHEERGLEQERILILWPMKTGEERTKDALRLYWRVLWLKNKLFTEIRTKRGWAYSVRAFMDTSGKDYALFGVEGGVKKGRGEKAVRIARRIVEETVPTERSVRKSKKMEYYLWLDEQERTSSLARDYAREIGLRNRTPEERIESIMSLSPEEVLRARDLLEEPLTLVVS